ncbi:MAG: DMT family transporter [Dictyoglomaceae bacterium]
MEEKKKAYFLLLIGTIAMSTASLFIRLTEAPPLIIATYRLIISSLILLLIYRDRIKIEKSIFLFLILSGLSLGVHFYTWISSVFLTSIANAVVLVNTNPLFVVLFSILFDKKRLPFYYFLSLAFVLFGMILIANNSLNTSLGKGELLALIAGFCMAIYLYIGQKLSEKISLISYIFGVYGTSAIFLFIVTLFSPYPLFSYPLKSYFCFLLLALIPQLLGHSSVNYALRILPASSVALVILGENVFATFWAYIFLNETISFYQGLGMLMITLAIMYNAMKERS